jgi:hypothetical protein
MNSNTADEVIYEIRVRDLQHVSKQVLERALTSQEVALIRDSVGNYIDWFQAIEHAIYENVA